jgi:phosphatidylserine decarboxylase
MQQLFILLQYLTPRALLSRLVGKLAECRWPWLKNTLISQFIKSYDVNMDEAEQSDRSAYPHFNAFFTRALRDGVRPVNPHPESIVCPADGTISQIGDIQNDRIFQAKGRYFSLMELLGGEQELASEFSGGRFATIYLSPRDYHRVHMPFAGSLRSMTYVPGDLFSVNDVTADNVPKLFARNERLVCVFDTRFGAMAMVLVGAMIVAAIETVWAGQVTPYKKQVHTTNYKGRRKPINLKKGEEMGRFKLGSTVILLFGKDAMSWQESYVNGSATRMGEVMGSWAAEAGNASNELKE